MGQPGDFARLLAGLFDTKEGASFLLEDADLDAARFPPWGEFDPILYWRGVLRELDKGAAENGAARLVAAARSRYPHNLKLKEYAAVRRGASPFVVGPPIDRDEDFFGRGAQRDILIEALQRGQSVEILGERRMGKTSLLWWAARHAPQEQDRPVALVSAQGIDGRSPTALVRAAGRALGRARR